jgi:hypothetical protein
MNDDTLLLRQVHPSWVQQGQITSQVFKPTSKDESQLSAYDGDLISAELAWQHYTGTLGFSSVGVVAVSVGECTEQDLPVIPDSEPFPEHVSIDFDSLVDSERHRRAKILKARATSRGWLHPVPESR